jgi:acyl-CoA reductase-like NAD-dependent aldehyde dehydrogenase
MTLRKILIGGQWQETSETFAVRNPYSGDHLADVASAGDDAIEASLVSAIESAAKMRSLSRYQIAKGLRAISAGIDARKDEFVRTIALESAKPVIYARGEVDRAIATFSWAAGEAERFAGEVVPIDVQPTGRGKWGRVIRMPRGVIYGITPFNFPLNLVAHKVAPALASGNAIIIKPSPRTPLTSLLLGEVFLETGLPISALQIVPTDVANVERIISDNRIAMLSFTGSAAVGWDLKTKVGKKPIALELGGNAPVIIDETADNERSLSRCVTGAFAYSGQVCISVQRIYVHSSKFNQWTDDFIERAEKLKSGDPLDEKIQISVMIDEDAAKRAEAWIGEATDNGAELLIGGKRDGSFHAPTVLTNTDPEMRIVAEEAFAPVAIVEKFDSIENAVEMCNNSKYGLQASIFSQDQKIIDLAVDRLEYGGVIVNDAPIFRVDNMPYGGIKESGFGREGVRYAMEEMTEIKLAVYED